MSPRLEAFSPLLGEWTTEAIHPVLPDTVVPGRTSFEWLEGEQFLILRSRNEHPDFPGLPRLPDQHGGRRLEVVG
jgi:hypothetical protein